MAQETQVKRVSWAYCPYCGATLKYITPCNTEAQALICKERQGETDNTGR